VTGHAAFDNAGVFSTSVNDLKATASTFKEYAYFTTRGEQKDKLHEKTQHQLYNTPSTQAQRIAETKDTNHRLRGSAVEAVEYILTATSL